MNRYRYAICDVFTANPLEGNQLAVFTDATKIPERLLQPLARELNFSETVFVYPPTDRGQAHVRIRIFMPTSELSFAGHPVLGTAFVLAVALQAVEVLLETPAGIIPVVIERDGAKPVFGWMRQPIPTWEPVAAAAADDIVAALGLERSELPVEIYDNGVKHVLVAAASAEQVAGLQPDLDRIARHGKIAINCFHQSGATVKLRMFAPGKGVSEDPATGSAAGPLSLHLARHGRIAFGEEIVISQGAEIGRPSTLYARTEGSADAVLAVQVGGSAVIVARGEFLL